MIKKISLSLILMAIFALQLANAGNRENYMKGWGYFNQNNRTEARNYFNQALNNPESKSDTYLSLSLLDWNENKKDAAFDNFIKFYESSSNPYPYLYAMYSLPFFLDEENTMRKQELTFFEKIVEDPNLNGTLRSMICEKLGTFYRDRNNFKKSQTYYDRMGALKNWQVLGTFDNTSGSGFNKNWGAVEKTQATDVFKNNVDAEVKWYTPVYNKENNWFMFDYYFYLENAIMYAQTFVNSTVDQEVYLRAGTSGSLKIWINDALVASVSDERNCDQDIYGYKIKLNKGNNRILVQIGASEIDRANFLIRLTDEKGNALTNYTSSAVYADYTKSSDVSVVQQIPFFAETYFEDQIQKDPENPLNYLLLSETFLRNDKAYEATKTLKNLEAKYGKSTIISYRLYEAYTRAKNQTDEEQEMETIKNSDPDSYFSLISKYSDAIKSEKYTEAQDILKKIKDLYGESPDTDGMDLAIASYQKRYDDVIALAAVLYKKYPNSSELMQLNHTIAKEVNKNPVAGINLIKTYLKNNYDENALNLLANEYFEQGQSAAGLKILYDRLAKDPYATGYYNQLIDLLFKMQMYQKAVGFAEEGMKLAPFLPNFYNNLGNLYKNMGQKEKAKENFAKAIYFSPTSYDARTQLRLLDEKKEIFDLFPKNNLKDLIASAPGAKEYPDDNSMFILNDFQQVVYPEGAKEYHREIAIKILKQSGIERWKEYAVGYNGYLEKLIIDKAEVIKSNGSVTKAETDDNNQVVFTNLEVNDVLHIEYRIQDYSTGKLASQFFDQFLFQYSIPSVVSRYSLLVPQDKKFIYKVANGKVEPEISNIENMTLYKWEVDNMPAVKSETYMSAFMDVVPTLHYSSIPDWKFVSSWYKDVTTSKFNSDYVLKETFNNLMQGKENVSAMEKAEIFYDYILKNISYSSVDFLQSNYIPQKASRTITTRLGDCKDLSTLFVALCRMANIDANLVLIDTRNNGNNTLALPAIGFNHCIAQLNVDNKKYFLELTDNNLPFGAAVKEDLGAQILPIPFDDKMVSDELLKMDMPQRIPNSSTRVHKISFVNNDMIIERDFDYVGAMTSYQRNDYKNIGDEEQLKKKSEAVAKDFKVSTKLTNLSFTNLNNLADTVNTSYKLEVKNALQDVAGMKIFTLPWTDINSLDIVNLESRTWPMEYWYYQVEDETTEKIIINLPQGKKMAENPQNVKLDCKTASYSVEFDTKTPGKVVILRKFVRKQDVIKQDDYASFREFLNKVSETDSKQFAFK
jgi:transglutaminase-like putative cysteine protease